MSSRNSLLNVEGGDHSCRTHRLLETAIKDLNLKCDYFKTTRCIHSNRENKGELSKDLKDKLVVKSADNTPRISHEIVMSSRSDRVAPGSEKSFVSIKTFTMMRGQHHFLPSSYENDSSELDLYVEDPKYKNLTPCEAKIQQDLEAHQAARKEAYNNWLRKKEDERKARNRMDKSSNIQEIRKSSEECVQDFRIWCERKKQLDRYAKRRQLMEHQRKEEEKKMALEGKEEKLKEWAKKKAQQLKEMKRKKKQEEEALATMKEVRKKESEEAYRKWLKRSKNKPLPVPLNQGELSMKGSMTEMYVNPEPWKHSAEESSSTSNISYTSN